MGSLRSLGACGHQFDCWWLSVKPYYDEGGITIYHGRAEDVLPTLPDESVELVFTSPPYNLGNSTGGGFPGKKLGNYDPAGGMSVRGGMGKWSGGALTRGYGEHGDNMRHADYVEWQQTVLRECWRLLGPAGAIFYNHKPRVLDGVVVTPFEYVPAELVVRQVVIWARAGGINFSPAFYCPTHEWIMVLAKAAWRLRSKAASGAGDVWRFPQASGTDHPAPFPIQLPSTALETTDAQSVLDPFCGSGTTLRAAKDRGVRAIGIELEERWCEYAAKRCAQETLFGAAA